ncbi:hypothetical protein ACFX2I_022868 [Malus domestica]
MSPISSRPPASTVVNLDKQANHQAALPTLLSQKQKIFLFLSLCHSGSCKPLVHSWGDKSITDIETAIDGRAGNGVVKPNPAAFGCIYMSKNGRVS